MNKFIIAFLLLFACAVQAEKTVKVPLTYAMDTKEDIVLRGQSQIMPIPISILDGQEVENVRLSLAIYNNNIVDSTVLWLAAGNRSLANIEVKQRHQFQYIEATFPAGLLSKENPSLNLRIQHLSNDPNLVIDTTGLNTTINVKASFYELNYQESGTVNQKTLASFEEMMRSGQHHDAPIHMISAITDSDLSLSLAAYLVQGWTLKSGSEDYQFDYRMESKYGERRLGPVIVYGTSDALLNAGWVDQETHKAVSGPYLGIGDSTKGDEWLLIISGKNEREVKRAAKVFANNMRRFPERGSMVVVNEDNVIDRSLKSEATYLMSEFTEQTDLTDSPLELDLVMPSNILFSDEDNAKINLLLSHSRVAPGAGSMILRVNGEYANSLPLRSSYWRDSQHYRLNIPMRKFSPGINRVSVEIYGPVDVQNQDRRFAVYMSEKSNLRLSSWVKFIPTEGHKVSAHDFFAIADDCGKQAQISVDKKDPVQLANLWRLLSYVSHRTHKAMPGLMITGETEQRRPFHISLTDIEAAEPYILPAQNVSRWDGLKTHLFDFVAGKGEAEQENFYTSDMMFSEPTSELATIKHTNQEGWYRIQFAETTYEKFDDFMRSESSSAPAGVLSEREFSSSTSQFFKAAFIGYPAGLSILALFIIWWMSAFVSRALEARK
ncbi:cellulose biosynthesis cyclic di-GMP-binding regulatory protein BcsB [Enterovibrio makurazakiensis]|uniref:cellulose biosynthesis cyclic di-GMP-binding regulatory protein BcsB n=1 Tax=Enterovibrio makurazakiensis TaxID=2910232 RepID=UPI003D1C6A66